MLPEIILSVDEMQSPQQFALLSSRPSSDTFFALKSRIENSSESWLVEFVAQDGLHGLLDSLCYMVQKGFTNFSDAILEYDCLCCVKTIITTPVGLKCMTGQSEYVRKLTKALSSAHTMTRKEVMEILAVICIHNSRSCHLVVDTLQCFKAETNQMHRFSVIVNELKNAETVQYKTTVLTLINCLINCCITAVERTRIRNEFIGLSILDILSFLHKEESDDDLHIHLKAFYSRKYKDEEELSGVHEVDFQNPYELLNKIVEKVMGSSDYISLIHILQDFFYLQMEKKESSRTWSVLESISHKIVHSDTNAWLEHSFLEEFSTSLNCKRQKLAMNKSEKCSCITGISDSPSVHPSGHAKKALTLHPSHPFRNLKPLQWLKLPESLIDHSIDSIWNVDSCFLPLQLDFFHLGELFSTGVYVEQGQPILLSKDSQMKVTLFLNRTDYEPDALIKAIQEGEESSLTLPTLRYLSSVLPCAEEFTILRSYHGPQTKLGLAEQFLLRLSDIPDFRTLIDGELLQAEFQAKFVKLRANVCSAMESCKHILGATGLKDIFHLILAAGNYLNHNNYYGRVRGFKVSSLSTVSSMKSCKPCHTLLNYLVQVIQNNDEDILSFTSEIQLLEKASLWQLDDIRSEVNRLNSGLKHFLLDLAVAEESVHGLFQNFIEDVKLQFKDLRSKLCKLRLLTLQMARYFCENEESFNLQQCFQQLHQFFKNVESCRKANVLYERLQIITAKRRHQLKSSIRGRKFALQFGLEAGASSSVVEEDKRNVMKKILEEVHQGNFQLPKSEANTPDRETHPLNISHISFDSNQMPIPPLDDADNSLDKDLVCAADMAEVRTSSDADLLSENSCSFAQRPKSVYDQVGQQHQKTHCRSRSDLTTTMFGGDKWAKYVELCCGEEKVAPLAKPESTFTLATLQLESKGQILSKETVCSAQSGNLLATKPVKFKKMEKRSSFGNFITRISRAVLKPKNVYLGKVEDGPAAENSRKGEKITSDASQKAAANKENVADNGKKLDVHSVVQESKWFRIRKRQCLVQQ